MEVTVAPQNVCWITQRHQKTIDALYVMCIGVGAKITTALACLIERGTQILFFQMRNIHFPYHPPADMCRD